jgi:hypothetical protein
MITYNHFSITSPVHAGNLDQYVDQDGAQDQLPDTLDPEVHHPPPEKLVGHQVLRYVEGEQEGQRHDDDDDVCQLDRNYFRLSEYSEFLIILHLTKHAWTARHEPGR